MELTIALCGDIMLGAEVAECMGDATVTDWLKGVSRAWSGEDLLIGNLECPCVVEAKPVKSPLPELIFHAPAHRLAELAQAGFSAVTLANNHVLNCGAEGLRETIHGLENVGIHHTGAGMSLAEALQPAFIPVRGLILGLVAFCYAPAAGRFTPGVAPYEPRLMRKALATARKRADIVIAALHDGLEYSDVPPAIVRARFRFLAKNGADLVVGHHPHVLQGLEWQGSVPIAYSLGDLIFHNSLPHVIRRNFARIAMGTFAPEEVRREPNKFARGAVLTVRLKGGKKAVQWHPFRQDANLRPQLCSGSEKLADLRRMDDLCSALSNEKDWRHGLADSVWNAVRGETLDQLGIGDILKLALKPKWRYVPRGLQWFHRKLSTSLRYSLE